MGWSCSASSTWLFGVCSFDSGEPDAHAGAKSNSRAVANGKQRRASVPMIKRGLGGCCVPLAPEAASAGDLASHNNAPKMESVFLFVRR